MRNIGIYSTVGSLLVLVMLFEHGDVIEPRWLRTMIRTGCLFVAIGSLFLFKAEIKKEILDEIRKRESL